MNFGVDIPFVNLLGFDLELFDGGRSQVRYLPHPDHRNAFAEATVFDEAGQACAHATGTFKYTHALANGDRGVKTLPS